MRTSSSLDDAQPRALSSWRRISSVSSGASPESGAVTSHPGGRAAARSSGMWFVEWSWLLVGVTPPVFRTRAQSNRPGVLHGDRPHRRARRAGRPDRDSGVLLLRGLALGGAGAGDLVLPGHQVHDGLEALPAGELVGLDGTADLQLLDA